MPLFRITYTDPKTGELAVVEKIFEDTPHAVVKGPLGTWAVPITAREWAENAAYSYADSIPC